MSDSPFTEVADRCWVSRRDWFDVNVGVVAGGAGLLVVDTFASAAGARRVLKEVHDLAGGLGGLPVLTAANTHVHFDHTFGNGVFEAAGATLVCHEAAAAALPAHAEEVRRSAAGETDPRYAALADSEPTVPGRTFSSALALDLGDRLVELVHPGRGHTDGDLVVHVPDAAALFAGDLVEESGDPAYGEDCWPLDWPASLDVIAGLLGPDHVVVPGHGAPVGRDFVLEQRTAVAAVAQSIADVAGRGVPLEQALAATEWPYPAERLGDAVRRGYAHLPRAGRRLPLA